MTFSDFIERLKGHDRVPDGIDIPRGSIRVGSAQAAVEEIAGLKPRHVPELEDDEIEELAAAADGTPH